MTYAYAAAASGSSGVACNQAAFDWVNRNHYFCHLHLAASFVANDCDPFQRSIDEGEQST
jgi:hypothetical protein